MKITFLLFAILFAIFTHAQVPSYVPTNGLVGWWPFNGNANDLSGNGNNGTVNGGVVSTTDRFGNSNNAYNFPGQSSAFINVGAPSNLMLQNTISISVWFTMSGGSFNPRLLQYGCGGQEFIIASIGTSNTSRNVTVGISGLGITIPNVPSLVWHHLIFVANRSTGTAAAYLNGNLIQQLQTTPVTSNISYSTNFNIGRMACPANDAWGGRIDDLAIYNRTLSQSEITALFTNTTPISPPTLAVTPSTTSICTGSSTTLSATANAGSSVCSSSQLPTGLQTGLVGYWPFCGNANDASGNGNNGTVNGATLTSDRFGNVNSAYNFGINQTINAGTMPNLGNNPTNYTQSVWFKMASIPSAPNNEYPLMSKRHDDSGIDWMGFRIESDSKIKCYADDSGYSGAPMATSGSLNANQWYHAVGVKNGSSYLLYVNGVLVDAITDSHPMGGSALSMIFGAQLAWQKYFIGSLDDIGIWNRALTATEIQQLYTLGQATYAWSPGGATTSSITVSPTTTTTYTCTATANGVSSTATSVVSVIPAPTITTANATICAGQSATLTASTTATAPACPTMSGSLTTGLVGFWPFCGNANDASGNGNNGTVNGATLTTDRFGNANSAYSFDGVNDYINIINPTILNFPTGVSFSVSFFYNPLSQVTNQSGFNGLIARMHNNSGTINGWQIGRDLNIYKAEGHGLGQSGCFPMFNSIVLNNWIHVVVVFNRTLGQIQYFNNGSLISTESCSAINSSMVNTYDLKFGVEREGNQYSSGKLDDIGIWNRALTASEIQQLYTQGQTTYSWSPGGATTAAITVSPTTTTTYTCTVTDPSGNACTATQIVTVNAIPTVNSVLNTVTCSGNSTNQISFTGSNATSYLWTNSLSSIGIPSTGSGNIPSFITSNNTTTPQTAAFSVTPINTVNGLSCQGTAQNFTITVNPIPVVTAPSNQSVCQGASTSAVNFVGSLPGTMFSWTNTNAAIGLAASGTGNIASFIGQNSTTTPATGIVTVTPLYTNASVTCTGPPQSMTFTVNPNPVANAGADFTKNCVLNTAGNTVGMTPASGISYTWTPATGLSSATVANPTANPSATTTYTLTATNPVNGCMSIDVVNVIVNTTPPIANAGADFTKNCILNTAGNTVGMTAVSGITYAWTPSTGLSSATVANPTANPSATTTYTLTATNQVNGCTANDAVVVTVNTTAPTVDAGIDFTKNCVLNTAGNTVGMAAVSGITYAWTPSTGLSSATVANPTANPTVTTTYTLTATNPANGCSANDAIVVTVNTTAPTVDAGIDFTKNCILNTAGNTVGMTAVSGITYTWTPATGLSSATVANPTANPSATTIYTLTATNPANGCTANDAVVVTVNTTAPTVDAGTDFTKNCVTNVAGNTVGMTAVSGISYAWTPTTGLSSSTVANPTANPSVTTTYTLTATNPANGCTANDAVIVTVNTTAPTVDAGTDFTKNCVTNVAGNTVGMTAVSGITYAWTPTTGLSSATVSNPTSNPTTTTTYTLTATNPANGCTANDAVVVTVNTTAPTVDAGTDFTKNCITNTAGNTVGTAAASGITYSWTPNTGLSSATVANPIANPAATTTYTLTATNPANGCTANDAVLVTVNTTAPTINAGLDQTVCQGSNVTLAATSNATIITWNNGVQNNVPFVASTPGVVNYTTTATGTNGCQSSDVMVLTILATPTVNGVANMVYCNGEISPLISFTGSNTTSFSWTNSTPSIGLAPSGVGNIASFITMNMGIVPIQATIVVTPINTLSTTSCTGVPTTFTIIVNPTPFVNSIPNQSICAGETTTPINMIGTGTSYNWINSNTTIGLPASGNGNIPSFVGLNTSSTSNVASISVTPLFTNAGVTCVGMQEDFTITVHPIPQVAPTPDQVVCCQSAVFPIGFFTNGVTVNWTTFVSSPLLTGHPSSGTGNIPSFTPINNSSTTEHIYFLANPISQFGCIGMLDSFIVSVLPCNIFADPVSSIAVCNGSNINAITFTGNATSFSWVNTNVTTGIPTSGTTSLPATTLTNNTAQTVTSQIIVTPEYTFGAIGCTGQQMTFDISTYPTPQVDAGVDQTICNGESTVLAGSGASSYSWSSGITDNLSFSPTSTQTYVVHGTDANGCVNIDSVTVIVNDPTTSTQTVTTCDSYTLNGQTYTLSGIYTQVIPNAVGCDSTITLDLTLNYSPSTPIVTIQNEVNLSTSNNTGVTYQWISCTDLTPIAGQTNSSFNPTVNGLYAVVVTNGCGSDTSECASVSTIGFNDLSNNEIKLYPNPNDGQFYLEIPEQLTNQQIEIFDLNGRLVFKQELNATLNLIQTEKLAKGSYLLKYASQNPVYFIIN